MQHLVLEHDAGRGRARRRHERAPRARRGRRRRLARRAADGARVHGASVSLADDRLDGRHPRARAARHPRVLSDVVRAEQRDDRRASATSTSDALRELIAQHYGAHPAGAAARRSPRVVEPEQTQRARRARAQADRDRSPAHRLQGARPGRCRLGRARDRVDAARRLPVGAAVPPARDRATRPRRRSTRS